MKLAVLATRRPSTSVSSESYEDCAPNPAKPAATCVSNTFVTSVLQAPAHERDVLAAGVHDDLDPGVREHRCQRRAVELLGQRIEHQDALARVLPFGDRELHQAQQRAVAALAHELGVQRQAPGRARAVG